MTKRQVFVSHTGQDAWIAAQIARGISSSGAKPFLDENDIEAGDDFEAKILSSLRSSHELVVLLTPWALDRPYVWAELGAAWARRIPIVALLLGITAADVQQKPGFPVFLKQRNLLPLNEVDEYFSQLGRRVRLQRKRAKDKKHAKR